jgi:cytochrome c oxidase cbb3-type subunit 1
MDDSELVHKPLVRAWARWALVWLTVFPFVGILVSIQFHNPEFLGGMSWSTFGRLRSVHLGGVLFGSFTTAFIGLLYYFVPRLCGTPLYKVEWGWWLLWMWNSFLTLGSLSLFMGYMVGVEYAEYEWPFNLMRFLVVATVAMQVIGTIFHRRASPFYVCDDYAWSLGDVDARHARTPCSATVGRHPISEDVFRSMGQGAGRPVHCRPSGAAGDACVD